MTIFWDPEDKRWCEECDEFLQQYHSLLYWRMGKSFQMKNLDLAMKNKQGLRCTEPAVSKKKGQLF